MKKTASLQGQLWALFILIFIDSLTYFLVIPVFERLFFADALIVSSHISLSFRNMLFGIAVLLSPLAFVISAPIAGHLSDKFGRKKILAACLLASLIGYLLPIIGIRFKSLILILLGRFIAGTATGSQPTAQAAIADMTEGKKKALYLAMIGFAMTLAMTLGPILGSLLSNKQLIPWFSLDTPYWVGALLSFGNLILLAIFFQETHKVTAKKIKPKLLSLFRNRLLIKMLTLFFLLELAWSQYYQALFLFLPKAYQYSNTLVGVFTGYIGIWMSLGLTFFYRFVLHFMTLAQCFKTSIWLIAIGLLGCSITSEAYMQWIFVILVAIFTGTAYASLLSLLSNLANAKNQGWILGISSTLLGISWTITGFTSGIFTNLSLYLPAYTALISIVIAGMLSFTHKNNHDD